MSGLARRLWWLCLPGLLSCASMWVPRVGDPAPVAPQSSEENAYQAVFEHYTAHVENYDAFDDVIFAAATFETVPFREARVHRRALFQKRPPQWEADEMVKERKAAEAAHEFTLAVHLSANRYEDFDRPNTMWQISLQTSAGEVGPTEIQRIGRGDLNLAAYYRYVDDFWIVFYLKFPTRLPSGGELIPPGTDQVTMKIGSTLARVELKFPAH